VMPLPEIIDNEKKIIRVLNVSYPLTIDNVAEKKCGICVHFHFRLFRDVGSIDCSIKYRTNRMYLPAGYYTLEK
jgi:hypothetical protein